MSFNLESHGDKTATIEIGEALDFRNASEFKELCKKEVDNGYRNFILDFSDTGILDSTGLGAVFSLYRNVSPHNGQVAFASISRPVQVVVQLTRTYKVFQQFSDVEAAREALMQKAGASDSKAADAEPLEEPPSSAGPDAATDTDAELDAA